MDQAACFVVSQKARLLRSEESRSHHRGVNSGALQFLFSGPEGTHPPTEDTT
jgi:hypothetical protein